MRHHSLWRALNLSVLGALSLLALSAVGAQAGEFKLKNNSGGAVGFLLTLITGAQIGEGLLLVPGRNLTLKCKSASLEAGSEILSPTVALALVEFKECTAFSHTDPTKQILCTIDNPLAIAKAFPKLHGGERYLLFEPDIKADATHTELLNGIFTTIRFLGASCPLPELSPIRGSLVALVDNNDTSKPELLFKHERTALEKEAFPNDNLTFGGFAATIQATAYILAIGAHLDYRIGIL